MEENKFDQMTDEEIEQFTANRVGFTLSQYRSLKKILESGIDELKEAVRYEVISVSIASNIAELPKENQLEALKRHLPNIEKDLPNLYDIQIQNLIDNIKRKEVQRMLLLPVLKTINEIKKLKEANLFNSLLFEYNRLSK